MDVRTYLTNKLEECVRYIYARIAENDETLGQILFTTHVFSILLVFVFILISHTIYPVIWFQVLVFIIVFTVWIQHIFLHTCICSLLELKLLGKDAYLAIDCVLELFKIPVSNKARMGITLMLSTAGVCFLGLELVARTVMYLREIYGFSGWA